MRALYFTHIYPHLIGAISIWGTDKHKADYIQPLIRTQKKIVRLIVNKPPRTHTKPLMNQLKILSIPYLYIYRVSIETHPYIHPTKQLNRPAHDHNYLSIAHIHDYPTRYARQKHQYIPNRSCKKNRPPAHNIEHLNAKYARVWNAIPEHIRDTRSLKTFKALLKDYLLEKQNNAV